MKKVFSKIHLWLSIPVGLIITIICLSGAILVFETELTELSNPTRYKVEQVKEKPLPMEQLIARVQKQLPDSMQIAEVQVSKDPEKNYRMGLSGRGRTAIYVDQYSGAIREQYTPTGNSFFMTMMKLHRWLLDDFKRGSDTISVGKTIVGVSTIIFVFIVITGIIIWVPKTIKALRQRYKIHVTKGWKRFWYDLHVVGGIYSALILLVLALTGLTWSFQWYSKAFYNVLGVEMPQRGGAPQQEKKANNESVADKRSRGNGKPDNTPQQTKREEAKSTTFSQWDKVVNQIKELDPQYRTITLRDSTATVSTDAIWGNKRASNRYTFDPQTGHITSSVLYEDQEKSGKVRGWLYSVHVGSWGGMTTKIITFLAAIFGASLPLTGYYFWIRKKIKKNRR